MSRLRISLFVLAFLATPLAYAQWQWVDKDGRKVFSDQPPPPGTPNDKILKRPGNRPAEPEAAPAATPAPASYTRVARPRPRIRWSMYMPANPAPMTTAS